MIELNDALSHAMNVKSFLAPYCERMEIAGSVRREKPTVKDLEIVVIPRMIQSADLFAASTKYSELEDVPMQRLGKVIKNGSRYKQIDLGGIMLDLFIVFQPAQFGVIFLIRTGPADFSKFMVTPQNKGGALPNDHHVENGAVWHGEQMIAMSEEKHFFEFCGINFIEPQKRANEKLWRR